MSAEMTDDLIPWLLEGEPWIQYRTRLDLLDQPQDHPQVVQARDAMLSSPPMRDLLEELSEWPGPILKSHKKAGHLLHKLGFLAEVGVNLDDPDVGSIAQRISEHRSSVGPYQILMNIHPRYGGSGQDEHAWMLCDAPLVTYAMARFGLKEDQAVRDSVAYLLNLQRENGWPCAVSLNLGRFRGPGRKDDPCPYANLVMLKLLTQFPEKHADPAAKIGVEAILSLWEQRKERRPYLFAMGTGFSRPKAPLIWYDILHVADVLTRFSWALKDRRLQELVGVLRSKGGQDGRFTAESIWMDWKTWEFGQKKEPSRWISLVAQRILRRSAAASQLGPGPTDR